MSRARRTFVALALVVIAGVSTASCGSSEDAVGDDDAAAERLREGEGESVLEGEVKACDPLASIPEEEVADLLPDSVTLPTGAVVIAQEDESTHVTVTAQLPASSGATPATLRKRYEDELEDAGYEITGGEDEGHESEVFFAFEDGRKGTVQSLKSSCPPDTVRVIVSYEKADS